MGRWSRKRSHLTCLPSQDACSVLPDKLFHGCCLFYLMHLFIYLFFCYTSQLAGSESPNQRVNLHPLHRTTREAPVLSVFVLLHMESEFRSCYCIVPRKGIPLPT